uniref:Epoxide hydrolase 4 n=1 Tax=Cajanus cajan TaxID=3821 RepID=A0A151RWG9_CAJCA|nr:Epoxide hydrolase 4 [Cajanus cajan]
MHLLYINDQFVYAGSKAVVFLHGFPEIWYTWRHQMIAVANAGYRAIAFDFRGYGLSQHPLHPEKETLIDLVNEIVGLLDALNISKKTLYWNTYEVPIAPDDKEIMDLFDPSTPLPPWFSEEDLETYASLYEKSGFRYALQVPYRSSKVETGLSNVKVSVPALLIMGEKDYVLKFPGMEDYIRSGVVKNYVADLEIVYIPEGSHFVHEQIPEKVNQLIIEFLDKQCI